MPYRKSSTFVAHCDVVSWSIITVLMILNSYFDDEYHKQLLHWSGLCCSPTMSIIAQQSGHQGYLVDINADRIVAWNDEDFPGSHQRTRPCRCSCLGPWPQPVFSTDVEKAVDEIYIVFISVNTSTETYDGQWINDHMKSRLCFRRTKNTGRQSP